MERIPAILGLVLLIGAVQCQPTGESTKIAQTTSRVATSPSETPTIVSHSAMTSEAISTKMTSPASMSTVSSVSMTTEHINMTTQTTNISTQTTNMTTQTTNMTTLPVNPSSVSSFTSTSHTTSETTVTSRTTHAVPITTPSSAPLPREKKGFEAWSFLGGVAVGLGMTLACVGLVYCITTKKMYSSDSVQYKAM